VKAEKKRCPRCKAEGSGPYARWVLNNRKQRYEPYSYFAHKDGKRIRWCYLGREYGKQLSNRDPSLRKSSSNPQRKGCRRCRHLTVLDDRPFCRHLQGFLAPSMKSQLRDCFEGEKR